MVFEDEFLVDARKLAVHAVDKAQGAEPGQVFVALLVLSQQELVVAVVLLALSPGKHLFMAVLHEVELAAHDGLEPPFIGLRYELEGAEHIAVVGQGDALLSVPDSFIHQGFDVAGPIQQGVLGMAMEVEEIRHNLLSVSDYKIRRLNVFLPIFVSLLKRILP